MIGISLETTSPWRRVAILTTTRCTSSTDTRRCCIREPIAVSDDLYDVCLSEFEGYVGRDFEASALDFYRLWPEQGLWDSGTRIGECLLFDVDGGQLTGSAYQSGW